MTQAAAKKKTGRRGQPMKPGQRKRGSKHNHAQAAEFRADIFRLCKLGTPKYRIAEMYDVVPSCITYHYNLVMAERAKEIEADSKEELAKKLVQLTEVQAEALEAWDKSKKDAEKRVQKERVGGKFEGSETIEERVGQCGDPRYLMVWLEAVEKELKLRRLYPDKEINVKGRVQVSGFDFEQLEGADEDRDEVGETVLRVCEAGKALKMVQAEVHDQPIIETTNDEQRANT